MPAVGALAPELAYVTAKFAALAPSGPMSILLVMTRSDFAQGNPELIKAVFAAQEEANALITNDPEEAVSCYLRMTQLNVPRQQLLDILADPENGYGVVPEGSLRCANFLAETGVIKAKPGAWTDLFLPLLEGPTGS